MFLPELNVIETSRDTIDEFLGYNHNFRINENEFFDMENLSADNYPLLSPRKKRGIYKESDEGIVSAIYKNGHLWTIKSTGEVYKDDEKIEEILIDTDVASQNFVVMGAHIVIYPIGIYINSIEDSQGKHEWGNINVSFSSTKEVTYTLCKNDGTAYEEATVSDTEPPKNEEDTWKDGTLWIDSSQKIHSLKQFSKSSGMWVSIATTYVKIQTEGIGKDFEIGDGVFIDGIMDETGQLSEALNGKCSIIQDKGDDYIVIIAILDKTFVQDASFSLGVLRCMPTMSYVIESNNRLWGCYCGMTYDPITLKRKYVNEIYASKLGDFKNWNCIAGVSTDSYTVSLGDDGEFSGAINHLGYPTFFKENKLYKVMGAFPAQYQLQSTDCKGVKQGCSDSIAIINQVVYYKTNNGIGIYDGSIPSEISSCFGNKEYKNAKGGRHKNKYYMSVEDANTNKVMFVYDTVTGILHKEDSDVFKFVSIGENLCYIDENKNIIKSIEKMQSENSGEKDKLKWFVETGTYGCVSPDKKYLSRLSIKMNLDIGTTVYLYVDYDSSGQYEHIGTIKGYNLRTFTIPIRPRRCDHLRLKIEGEGDAKIYSITKTLEGGSDI